ncbi:MAG: formylglycine-generating enzyme family protein, partial [Alphaproteobacteria bacterium]|nr:formylglycine-generating enzyme family protein [Alphaproteobacteria bacterium]
MQSDVILVTAALLLVLGTSVAHSETRVPLSAEAERALKPKDLFQECDQGCPEMVVVPAGSFTMGSPESEKDRYDDEGPQHVVTIRRPFAVGRFAVTFDEWDACVADGGCGGYRPEDASWGRGRRPTIYVSWNDAKAYVAWLAKKTGNDYRLLSEAEREYVTRAGTSKAFWWGSCVLSSQANFDGYNVNVGEISGEFRRTTLAVDSFEANPFGLYQVHGNVWEWVEDCWHDTYRGAPTDGSVWTSGDCRTRVLRGGSWRSASGVLRSASRLQDSTDTRDVISG